MRKKKYDCEEYCTIKDIPKGVPFRLVNSKGKVGNKVYYKGEYDRSEKKYLCDDAQDMWGYGKYIKPKQKVFVGFEY